MLEVESEADPREESKDKESPEEIARRKFFEAQRNAPVQPVKTKQFSVEEFASHAADKEQLYKLLTRRGKLTSLTHSFC